MKVLRALQARTGGSGVVFPAFPGATRALSKHTMGPGLHKAMEQAGIPDTGLYAAHSLRRGGAAHAPGWGCPPDKL